MLSRNTRHQKRPLTNPTMSICCLYRKARLVIVLFFHIGGAIDPLYHEASYFFLSFCFSLPQNLECGSSKLHM